MFKKLLAFAALALFPLCGISQSAQRIYTALQPNPGGGKFAEVIPSASVYVCQWNAQDACDTQITVYSDRSLTQAITQPIVANAVTGVYQYYIQPGTQVIEKVCAPYNQCTYNSVMVGDYASGSGGQTVIEVNGTPAAPTSPVNFANSSTVSWSLSGNQITATSSSGSGSVNGSCASLGNLATWVTSSTNLGCSTLNENTIKPGWFTSTSGYGLYIDSSLPGYTVYGVGTGVPPTPFPAYYSGLIAPRSGTPSFFSELPSIAPSSPTVYTWSTPVSGIAPETNFSLQGTDTKILTSGTISGTSVSLCTDANGGATTVGCPSIQTVIEVNGISSSPLSPVNFVDSSTVSWVISGNSISATGSPTLAIQTNSVANSSQTLINMETSTANVEGLTITPSNPSGGIEKFEITGASYLGNAATATELSTTGSNLQVWGVSGGVQGWINQSGGSISGSCTTLGDLATWVTNTTTLGCSTLNENTAHAGWFTSTSGYGLYVNSALQGYSTFGVGTGTISTPLPTYWVGIFGPTSGTPAYGIQLPGTAPTAAHSVLEVVPPTTINGLSQAVSSWVDASTLGSTTFQVNGTNLLTQSPVNVENSVTNAAGFSVTVSNPSAGNVVSEVGVANAATARSSLGAAAALSNCVPETVTGTLPAGSGCYYSSAAITLTLPAITAGQVIRLQNTATTANTQTLSFGSSFYCTSGNTTTSGTTCAVPQGNAASVTTDGTSYYAFVAPSGSSSSSIANIQVTVGTTAIAANTCTLHTAATMTGLTTTSTVQFTSATDFSSTVGWSAGATGQLYFFAWPTANTLNYYVCNPTASSITPGASTTWNVSANAASSGGAANPNITVANAGTTGTTLDTLTKLTGAPSTAVIAATADTGGAVGIVTGGAGTTGSATITTAGQVSCVFSNATTAGDYVQISSATAGNCLDSGATYPTTGQVVGRVLSTNAAAGTYQIDLFPSEIKAASGGGSSGPSLVGFTYVVDQTATSLTTPAFTVSVGQWVTIGCRSGGSTTPTVSDSLGNTYTTQTSQGSVGTYISTSYTHITVGGSDTFTCNWGTSFGNSSVTAIVTTGETSFIGSVGGNLGSSAGGGLTYPGGTASRSFAIQCTAIGTTTGVIYSSSLSGIPGGVVGGSNGPGLGTPGDAQCAAFTVPNAMSYYSTASSYNASSNGIILQIFAY